MSPDAVWRYGCASKFAEPVSIQVPQHRAASPLQARGPSWAAETAQPMVKTDPADPVGYCLPSRPLIDRLSPNTGDVHRWCQRISREAFASIAFTSPPDIYPFGTLAW
jgi:hypothetical protein